MGSHRERASDSHQHRLGDADEGATTRKDLEPTRRGASIGLAQPPAGNGAEDRTSGFGESVNADVTRLPCARMDALAGMSRSSNAATSALDSM